MREIARRRGDLCHGVWETAPDPLNTGIVSDEDALTPLRRKTRIAVRKSILTSSKTETWSTYQTSSSNFLSQEIALRPFTWAQPVIPGRTSCRRACSGE